MNNSDYTVEVIETLEGFEDIKEDWERLFSLKKDISLFFSFEVFKIYYETTLNNFNNVKMKIFIIKNKYQKIVAIFPLTLEINTYFKFLKIKELSIKNPNRIGFYNFIIDPNENHEIIFQRFIEYLKKRNRTWDIIKFCHIPENEELYNICKTTFSQYFKIEEFETETLVVNCNREFDEYIKNNMEKRPVTGIKRRIRRLHELGKLKLIEIGDDDKIEDALKHFYDIEDKNWKGRAKSSLKKTYQGELYAKFAQYFSKKNRIIIYFLQLNDQNIAGLYTIIDQGVCYLIKAGYDEDFYPYSPSTVLLYSLFEKLFGNKEIKKIDFFGPYYQHQKNFGNQTRKRYNLYVYNNKPLPHFLLIGKTMLVKCRIVNFNLTGFTSFNSHDNRL